MSLITEDTNYVLTRALIAFVREHQHLSEAAKAFIILFNKGPTPINKILLNSNCQKSINDLKNLLIEKELIDEIEILVERTVSATIIGTGELHLLIEALANTVPLYDRKAKPKKITDYYYNNRFLIMVRLCELTQLPK